MEDYTDILHAYGTCPRGVSFGLPRAFGHDIGAGLSIYAESIGTSPQFLTGALMFAWGGADGSNAVYEVCIVHLIRKIFSARDY